jgi:hypothetical protein
MFSPISKILTIHYFSLNPFSIIERKVYTDHNSYIEMQSNAIENKNKKRYILDNSNIFMQNKKEFVSKSRVVESIDIDN